LLHHAPISAALSLTASAEGTTTAPRLGLSLADDFDTHGKVAKESHEAALESTKAALKNDPLGSAEDMLALFATCAFFATADNVSGVSDADIQLSFCKAEAVIKAPERPDLDEVKRVCRRAAINLTAEISRPA
jgi:hypothetical protein